MKLTRRGFLGGLGSLAASAALAQGSYLKQIGAIAPAAARGPPVYSTDAATWGAFYKQQIPAMEIVRNGDGSSRRIFWVNYGGILPEAAVSGEDAGCYARLQWSDAAVISDAMTVNPQTFWVPDIVANANQQPMVAALNNNTPSVRALVASVYAGTGGQNRSVWGTILQNPLADPASWVWSRQIYMGRGFISPIRYLNGALYYSAYEAEPNGCKFYRLDINGDTINPVHISTVTDPPADQIDYFEPSWIILNNGVLRCLYRTEGRQFYCDSPNMGASSWGPSAPFTLVDTVSSRCDWLTLPNGYHALAFNNSLTKRENGCIAVISPDGSTVVAIVVIDARGSVAPHCSYFNLCLDPANPNKLYCTWDCGRGNQNPPTDTNEIIMMEIDIPQLMLGILSATSCTRTT